ncbi:LON peptidase substrate-binding domain-containing protein [Paracoccus aerodenitrificans]|uniref:LON peptidase substrate-binding domain-containing protein n=1 Tax=Paracoccus aerodenitrificans TaxID=3017781 RepID=UPI0022F00D0C|nr:LON peptidase substrate-binding domain-containing protein [Paracoccus aerodenitrificans]WBU64049.1 LON peptidase substrate-binding domain-containing protein [Paracoccus aerodenitrificans]
MIRRDYDLPETLPLFVLPGAVLLPRTRLPLDIFEPRYLQMVEDTLRTPHRLIGMIQPLDESGEVLAQVGSAGRIVGFSEQEDGRYLISLGQVSRYRLTGAEQGFQPYPTGHVDWAGFDGDHADAEDDPGLDRSAFLDLMRRYMDANDLSTDWEAAEDADTELLVNSLAMALPLEVQDKQALLETGTLAQRRELLEGLLEYELRHGENEEVMQ